MPTFPLLTVANGSTSSLTRHTFTDRSATSLATGNSREEVNRVIGGFKATLHSRYLLWPSQRRIDTLQL